MRRAAITIGVVSAMAFAFAAVGGVGGALGARTPAGASHDRDGDCRIGSKHCVPTTTITKTRTSTVGGASTVTTTATATDTTRTTEVVDGGVLTVVDGVLTQTTGTVTDTLTDTTTLTDPVTSTQTETDTTTLVTVSTQLVDEVTTAVATAFETTFVDTTAVTVTNTITEWSTLRSVTVQTEVSSMTLSCLYLNGTLTGFAPPNGGPSCDNPLPA
ncbi:MAG: hypothetical protein U0869_08805 [Chloroflexota bacterium]